MILTTEGRPQGRGGSPTRAPPQTSQRGFISAAPPFVVGRSHRFLDTGSGASRYEVSAGVSLRDSPSKRESEKKKKQRDRLPAPQTDGARRCVRYFGFKSDNYITRGGNHSQAECETHEKALID